MRRGTIGTPMIIVRVPKKKKSKKAKRKQAIATRQKIGKEGFKQQQKHNQNIRRKPRPRPVPKTDVKVDDNMLSLKEKAIKEGKYLGK